jgi:acyl carrier protein
MMPEVVMGDIQRIIGLQLGIRDVPVAARIVEDLGAESADVANIIAAVESKYGIRMKESEIARLDTPADLYEAVRRHLPPS